MLWWELISLLQPPTVVSELSSLPGGSSASQGFTRSYRRSHLLQPAPDRPLSARFWSTGGHYHRWRQINGCGRAVVTSALLYYDRIQRADGPLSQDRPCFGESCRQGMMGFVGLNARLSGRDVTPGDRRSPYCPSMWGFVSTALCIPN